MNIIQAIEIKTNSKVENETYGLYAVTDEYSEFRFSECALSGTPKVYKDGFVLKNGIGNLSQQSDMLESGAIVQSSDITIRIKNTNQLNFFMDVNSISVYNCEVKIVEFVGTDSDADSIASRVVTIRTIEQVQWSDTELTLKVKMSLTANRTKLLSKRIDTVSYPYAPDSSIDKMIPVMFGSSDPANGRYFKINRTSAKEINLDNIGIRYLANKSTIPMIVPAYLNKFPVSENASTNDAMKFKIGYYAPSVFVGLCISDKLAGLYVNVVDGISEITGIYRKIETSDVTYTTPDDYPLLDEISVECTLDNYIEKPVVGNATSNAVDQCWIEMYDLSNEYQYTHHNALGFYDSSDATVVSDYPEIYCKDNDLITPILESGCDISTQSNVIKFNPMLFNGAIDSVKSFKVLPVSGVSMYNSANLDTLGLSGYHPLKITIAGVEGESVGGFYKDTTDIMRVYSNSQSVYADPANCIDKNYNTYTQLIASNIFYSGSARVLGVVEISLPPIPDNMIFKSCYLGVDIDINLGFSGAAPVEEKFIFSKRGFYGGADVVTKTFGTGGIWSWSSIRNIPDFYYQDVAEKNYNFIVSTDAQHTRGYKLFDLGAGSVTDYRNLHKVFLAAGMRFTGSGNSGVIDIRYVELAVIFEGEQTISKEVYI